MKTTLKKRMVLAFATVATMSAISAPTLASTCRVTRYVHNDGSVTRVTRCYDDNATYYDDRNDDADANAAAGLAIGAVAGATLLGIAMQGGHGHWHGHGHGHWHHHYR